jgi:hypothetical protein
MRDIMKAISLFVMKAPSILSAMFLALCIGGSTNIHAQGYQAGFYFTTLSPSGEFNENVTDNGWGFNFLFLKRVGPSPLLVGADYGFVVYGSENRLVPISTTIPPVQLKVDIGSSINFVHLLTRVQPRKGGVRPYADGLIGLKHLSSNSVIANYSGEVISGTGKTYVSDSSLSYGVGGGLQIPLAKSGEDGLMLDGNVRYLRGGRARYLKKGSIREVDGVTIFDVLASRTDVIAFQIGITFRF